MGRKRLTTTTTPTVAGTTLANKKKESKVDVTISQKYKIPKSPKAHLWAANVLLPAQQDPPVSVRQQSHEGRRSGGQVSQSPGEAFLEGFKRRLTRPYKDKASLCGNVFRFVPIRDCPLEIQKCVVGARR